MSIGIDYGLGQTNIDKATGIRYGVISNHSVSPDSWNEVSEADYGEPTCPKCGDSVADTSGNGDDEYEQYSVSPYGPSHGCADYVCHTCKHTLDNSDVYGDEPLGYSFTDEDYFAHCGTEGFGIWIERSPFYTYAGFCSPCAPGAGDLDNALLPTLTSDRDRYDTNPSDHGVKTYCFGHDWFDGGVAPYRVFRVSDNSEVLPEDK
jgi:hypothetical protein